MAPATQSYRIYDTRADDFISLVELTQRLSDADVILFGEQHDDSVAHAVQRDLLQSLGKQPRPLVLGLESFERDVQPQLDAYLAGHTAEAEFLATSRPWPNYSSAYRALVEIAKERGWPVLASNVPRRIAAAVARGGLETLQNLTAEERAWVAGEALCPKDAYFERFVGAMAGHGGGTTAHPGQLSARAMERLYEAQCIKDETMAEAIREAIRGGPDVRVMHVQGGFHSDYRHGIVPRLQRRAPEADVRTISAVPVADLETIDFGEYRGRADYLVFTHPELGNDAIEVRSR